MQLGRIIKELELEVLCGGESLDREVTRGYSSDLMSDVIANAHAGDIWVTLQIHLNVIAIASMKDIAAVVIIGGREPQSDTIERAQRETIPVLRSRLPAFELNGRLYQLGIPGL